ncbi:hypothetical protein LIER_32372 [Lithospermum erythrorhizon]|uniref:Uncharacterized protein n=1 Tax=Lithospermum erythrorhizon TaxID=34254 RepID=A0AAV3RVV3_LITER
MLVPRRVCPATLAERASTCCSKVATASGGGVGVAAPWAALITSFRERSENMYIDPRTCEVVVVDLINQVGKINNKCYIMTSNTQNILKSTNKLAIFGAVVEMRGSRGEGLNAERHMAGKDMNRKPFVLRKKQRIRGTMNMNRKPFVYFFTKQVNN